MRESDEHVLSTRIPSALHKQLSRSAQRHERSVSGEVRAALKQHLRGSAGPLLPVEPLERAAAVDCLNPVAPPEGDGAA